jgi:hypothetical protein
VHGRKEQTGEAGKSRDDKGRQGRDDRDDRVHQRTGRGVRATASQRADRAAAEQRQGSLQAVIWGHAVLSTSMGT